MEILKTCINKPASVYRGFAALCQVQLQNQLHTSSLQSAKKVLPFEYVKPTKEKFNFRKWDLEGLKSVDLKNPKLSFHFSSFLKSDACSEATKKILSLEFAPRREMVKYIKAQSVASVRKHCLDTGSFEATIASLTTRIRSLQIIVKEPKSTRFRDYRRKRASATMSITIKRRNKLLNTLRARDFSRFEWLVQELKIVYRIPEKYSLVPTRNMTIREMTQKYCEDIRIKKIASIREKLQAQQAAFLKEKEEKLRIIAEEEKALGLTPEIEAPQTVDEENYNLPPPVASTLLRIAQTAEGPYVEPPFIKKRKLPPKPV